MADLRVGSLVRNWHEMKVSNAKCMTMPTWALQYDLCYNQTAISMRDKYDIVIIGSGFGTDVWAFLSKHGFRLYCLKW